MESKEETIVRLRQRLGREPTEHEINEARNALIRQRYADMALTAMSFQDEADADGPPVRDTDQAVEEEKLAPAWEDLGIKEIDFRELFNRVALHDQRFHDEWIENICELIRTEGRVVGRQEWDSGGPGAGAGTVVVYAFRGVFIGDTDAGMFGPYDSFAAAAAGVGLLAKTSATTNIWVDPRFR